MSNTEQKWCHEAGLLQVLSCPQSHQPLLADWALSVRNKVLLGRTITRGAYKWGAERGAVTNGQFMTSYSPQCYERTKWSKVNTGGFVFPETQVNGSSPRRRLSDIHTLPALRTSRSRLRPQNGSAINQGREVFGIAWKNETTNPPPPHGHKGGQGQTKWQSACSSSPPPKKNTHPHTSVTNINHPLRVISRRPT